MAAAYRKEIGLLRRMIHGLQEMEWELKYRMTGLPELCLIAGDAAGGIIKDIFHDFSGKLSRNEVTDIAGTLNAIIIKRDLPRSVRKNLKQLGSSLGRYELEGQLQGLEFVRRQCRKDLQELETGSVQRLRNYQTLALCAGIALAIIFI